MLGSGLVAVGRIIGVRGRGISKSSSVEVEVEVGVGWGMLDVVGESLVLF